MIKNLYFLKSSQIYISNILGNYFWAFFFFIKLSNL